MPTKAKLLEAQVVSFLSGAPDNTRRLERAKELLSTHRFNGHALPESMMPYIFRQRQAGFEGLWKDEHPLLPYRELSAKNLHAFLDLKCDMPFFRIPEEFINPFSGAEPDSTIYLLGSPGAGKSELVKKLGEYTKGTLALESGVFAMFQAYYTLFGRRLQEFGPDAKFIMPNLDGLSDAYTFFDQDPTT
ncbi:MAG: hypothetical protein HGA85_03695, partial [Nanoarchaeota archaeon]|nr:hypothetical protein [Nanoarchaeota archaeon]